MESNTLKNSSPLIIKGFNILVKKDLNQYFDFDKLIESSRQRSGLSNFGKDFWEEPIKVLLKSIIEESEISSWGAYILREKLIGQLVNRLRAENWFSEMPEILEQELLPVYLITGLQRTGTTKLQRMLSEQEGARGLLSWEAMNPAPIKKFNETKKRIRLTTINAKAVKWMAPEFNKIHPIIVNQPEEDVLLLDMTFLSTTFEAILKVPSYSKWLEESDNTLAYEYEVKVLKLLQKQRSGKYWVLKSPHHLEHLDLVHKYLKPKRIIYTHRDLMKVMPSFMSMLYYSRALFSNNVCISDILSHWQPKMKRMVELAMRFNVERTTNIFHLEFDNWINSEKEVIASILDMESSHVQINNNKYVSKHKYDAKTMGIIKEDMEEVFKDYTNFRNAIH